MPMLIGRSNGPGCGGRASAIPITGHEASLEVQSSTDQLVQQLITDLLILGCSLMESAHRQTTHHTRPHAALAFPFRTGIVRNFPASRLGRRRVSGDAGHWGLILDSPIQASSALRSGTAR